MNRVCFLHRICICPAEFGHTLEFFFEGVSQNRFLPDPGPNLCSGRINTTKMYGISRRIQWDQSRGLAPRFPAKKNYIFLIGVRIFLGMEIGKIITKSIRSEHLGFYNFGRSFASPSGEIHFRKTHPKLKTNSLNNYKVFLSN